MRVLRHATPLPGRSCASTNDDAPPRRDGAGVPPAAERMRSSISSPPSPHHARRSARPCGAPGVLDRLAHGSGRRDGGILSDEIECFNARGLPQNLMRPADGRYLDIDGCPGRVTGACGRQDRRVGRRLPCPTNVGKALSSTLSIVTTGRSQRQGCAVPSILTWPSLRFDHDKISTPTPRLRGRCAVL